MFLLLSETNLWIVYISVTDNITIVCSNYYFSGYILVFIMLLNFFFMYDFNFAFILPFKLRIFYTLRTYIFHINLFLCKDNFFRKKTGFEHAF